MLGRMDGLKFPIGKVRPSVKYTGTAIMDQQTNLNSSRRKSVGPDNQPTLDVQADLQRLRSVNSGLSRSKDAILIYLAEIYRTGEKLRYSKKTVVLSQLNQIGIKLPDRRVTKSPYRLLLELTCDVNVKLKSRYANALNYARRRRWDASELKAKIKAQGGIENCARAYTTAKS